MFTVFQLLCKIYIVFLELENCACNQGGSHKKQTIVIIIVIIYYYYYYFNNILKFQMITSISINKISTAMQ